MKWWLKSAGVLCAFWLNVWISAGQARSVGSAEAGPLKIRRVTRSNPRPITMSDLLTIRDCEGLSISPDGTHVAFVVGQAVYETNSYRSALFIVSTDSKHEAVNLGSAGSRWSQFCPREAKTTTCGLKIDGSSSVPT